MTLIGENSPFSFQIQGLHLQKKTPILLEDEGSFFRGQPHPFRDSKAQISGDRSFSESKAIILENSPFLVLTRGPWFQETVSSLLLPENCTGILEDIQEYVAELEGVRLSYEYYKIIMDNERTVGGFRPYDEVIEKKDIFKNNLYLKTFSGEVCHCCHTKFRELGKEGAWKRKHWLITMFSIKFCLPKLLV